MAKTLKITLVKSPITYAQNQKDTLKALADAAREAGLKF